MLVITDLLNKIEVTMAMRMAMVDRMAMQMVMVDRMVTVDRTVITAMQMAMVVA